MTTALDFDGVMGTLFTAYRRVIDAATLDLYGRALTAVPLPLLSAAVGRAVRTRRFFPSVAELLEDAEACRRELSALYPHSACADCLERPGWVTVVDPQGISREARCPCWYAHQARLRGHGLPERPVFIALPAGDPEATS